MFKKISLIMVIFVMFIFLSVPSVVKATMSCSDINSMWSTLQSVAPGFVGKISYANYYVNEYVWRNLNVDQKETYMLLFANHYKCNGGGALRCVVYSYQSGKKLGKYGAWGFTYY